MPALSFGPESPRVLRSTGTNHAGCCHPPTNHFCPPPPPTHWPPALSLDCNLLSSCPPLADRTLAFLSPPFPSLPSPLFPLPFKPICTTELVLLPVRDDGLNRFVRRRHSRQAGRSSERTANGQREIHTQVAPETPTQNHPHTRDSRA
ncbi:hypothetical protein GQ53DRAFT_74535 [Thozetella sp. PMI_491]|nr:hypothetical protein GQ53DRAFT_74535 [Thozetella sp. PMI_491]